jgi:hypothetical protein
MTENDQDDIGSTMKVSVKPGPESVVKTKALSAQFLTRHNI